ncbi:MAG: alcohol dehydrogenase catalytic domain-containing protein [Acidobacteriota bacterium]
MKDDLRNERHHPQGLPVAIQTSPLEFADVAVPQPAEHELLVRVHACGVCRTDLHVIEGELTPRRSPVIPGHQIVGVVERTGPGVSRHKPGDRVGIAWLHATCGLCEYCLGGAAKTCVTTPNSPATPSMAGSRNTR